MSRYSTVGWSVGLPCRGTLNKQLFEKEGTELLPVSKFSRPNNIPPRLATASVGALTRGFSQAGR